jgi:enamine deaminase RidA (YjgF/YER057c/UK114 family)
MVREIQRINPIGLYDPSPNGYTHVATVPPGATIVYVAGQGGEDENGNLIIGDFAAQLKQAFANLYIALAAVGASPEQVVKLTTLVVEHDQSKLQQIGTEIQAMWGDQPPTQTLIPVPRLALDGMLFEVDAVAVLPNS